MFLCQQPPHRAQSPSHPAAHGAPTAHGTPSQSALGASAGAVAESAGGTGLSASRCPGLPVRLGPPGFGSLLRLGGEVVQEALENLVFPDTGTRSEAGTGNRG